MRLITAAVLVTNGLLLALSSPPLPGIQQSPPGRATRSCRRRSVTARALLNCFSIADVDEDGRPDIATGRSDAPNVLYLASATRR